MRKYLLATSALLVCATPAVAKDNSGYVGIDIGAVWPKSHNLAGGIDFANPLITDIPFHSVGSLGYNAGVDADLIGGYDFGMFRLEGELGYKHGNVNRPDVAQAFLDAINSAAEANFTANDFNIDDKTNAWSGMVNGWLDLGGEEGNRRRSRRRRRLCRGSRVWQQSQHLRMAAARPGLLSNQP